MNESQNFASDETKTNKMLLTPAMFLLLSKLHWIIFLAILPTLGTKKNYLNYLLQLMKFLRGCTMVRLYHVKNARIGIKFLNKFLRQRLLTISII